MSEQTSEDQEKVDAYLDVIQQRILEPIEKTAIGNYCTATLLLLFAAIDGLGKLLHPNDNAQPADRIKSFLDYMGGDYAAYKNELVRLRRSVVHNAINVESFLSRASEAEIDFDQHLKKIGSTGLFLVNTVKMYRDFVEAFNRFRTDVQRNPTMLKRAADRLEWKEESLVGDLGEVSSATPTPPPPVCFIRTR
jgi:hypothetical protein